MSNLSGEQTPDRARAERLLERMTIEWNPQDDDLDILAAEFAAVRAEERERCARIAAEEEREALMPVAGLTAMKIRQAIERECADAKAAD